MILEAVHLEFWRQRKAPQLCWPRMHQWAPQWAGGLEEINGMGGVTIHTVVNAHSGDHVARCEAVAHDAVEMLRHARARGASEMTEWLDRLMVDPLSLSAADNPERRAGYCRKWLARIRKERIKRLCAPNGAHSN